MFTKNDVDSFVHVTRTEDGGFLIVQKDPLMDMDVNNFHVVKAEFEHSSEYTKLKSAKELCEDILDLLGVSRYCEDTGIALAVEVIKKPKKRSPKLEIN